MKHKSSIDDGRFDQLVKPNGYNYGKHKRGATARQQSDYIADAYEKRMRKNAKRAKEAGHVS